MSPPVTRKLDEISAIFIHNNIGHGIHDCFLERGAITPLTDIKVNERTIYEVLVSKSQPSPLGTVTAAAKHERRRTHSVGPPPRSRGRVGRSEER